jgi:DNA-directed RNA polymerase subunit omega
MARITIEDCIEQVPNRFQLVQMTAIRAKQLKKGATALVQNEENKDVVVALREIAAGKVKPDERPAEDFGGEDVVEALADEAVVETQPAEGAESEEAQPEGEGEGEAPETSAG